MFVGFGAILGSSIFYYYPGLQYYQTAIVGLLSLLCFLILYRPLKSFLYNKDPNSEYSDLIGKQVEVAFKDINSGETGQVYWSGTIMNAQIYDHDKAAYVGDKLYIREVKGNILICSHSKNNQNEIAD